MVQHTPNTATKPRVFSKLRMAHFMLLASCMNTSRIIATPQVWLEGEAVRQLEQTAQLADCVAAVGMPDLHPGPTYPIGAAFGFSQTIHPRLVGSDAGCGALVVVLDKVKFSANVERRLEQQFNGAPPSVAGHEHAPEQLVHAVWHHGVKGLLQFDVPATVAALVNLITDAGDVSPSVPPQLCPYVGFANALGTVGGGNHFAEIGRVCDVFDQPAAERMRLNKDQLVLLCHSGSRGLGKAVADTWSQEVLHQNNAAGYLADLAGAVRFAQANRIFLAWRLLEALGMHRTSSIGFAFDVVHNCVNRELVATTPMWVHRKGCAPAHQGQSTVVLGSRGTRSWIMTGTGNPDGLSSVAHGAGRKMMRSLARANLRARYHRDQLIKTRCGSKVICDDSNLLYEEHPDAYKPIEPVIDSLEQAGLATKVAAVMPLLTVKK